MPSCWMSSRPIHTPNPTTSASSTRVRRNVPNARSTIRPTATTSSRMAGRDQAGRARLDAALVGHHREDPGRDHQQAEQEAERARDAEDLVGDELAGARDRAVEGRPQVGRGLRDHRQHDPADGLLELAEGRLEARQRRLDLVVGGEPAGDLDHAVDQRRNDRDHGQPEDGDGDELGDQRRQDARHVPVEAVGERQDRVGDDGADDERRERGPRGDRERQRDAR